MLSLEQANVIYRISNKKAFGKALQPLPCVGQARKKELGIDEKIIVAMVKAN